MIKKNLIPVCVGILVLSGFIMGAAGGCPTGPAPVPKTGVTLCYDASGHQIPCTGTGQDGELQKGVASPSPRFTDNLNRTVTDNLTGLIWTQDANCAGGTSFDFAINHCKTLAAGACGLSDGSKAGDWRLPNYKEMLSLVDYSHTSPALPADHLFTNLAPSGSACESPVYWTSTLYVDQVNCAGCVWGIGIQGDSGPCLPNRNTSSGYEMCVRGGQ